MASMTRDEAVSKIYNSNGKLFSVVFTKRGDGSERHMVARLGVVAHLKGGSKSYDAASKNLITCFDVHAVGYRSLPIEGLKRIMVKGEWFDVTDAPPAPKHTCCSFPQSDELGGCSTYGAYWGDR